jgi:hypothetical protein
MKQMLSYIFVSLGQKRVRVSLRAEADSRGLHMLANTRKTVSGRVIHKIFCANFCRYLLNKS